MAERLSTGSCRCVCAGLDPALRPSGDRGGASRPAGRGARERGRREPLRLDGLASQPVGRAARGRPRARRGDGAGRDGAPRPRPPGDAPRGRPGRLALRPRLGGRDASPPGRDRPFLLRGVTANVADPRGTYGLALTALREAEALRPGETGIAPWLTHTAAAGTGFRTNVAVALLEPGTEALVTIVDDTGSRERRGAPRGGGAALLAAVGRPSSPPTPRSRSAGSRCASSRGSAVAYAAVVDNVTGDGLLALARRVETPAALPTPLLLPGAARVPGANGTLWRTGLRLVNPGLVPVEVTLEVLGGGGRASRASSRRAASSRRPTSSARSDIPEGSAGAVRVTAPERLSVLAATRNVDPSGRPGPSPPRRSRPPEDALAGPGRVLVVHRPLGRLRHVGLPDERRVRRRSRRSARAGSSCGPPSGERLAEAGLEAGPSSWTQRSLSDWLGGAAVPRDATLEVTVESGSLDAYASVIDNGTGDPVILAPAFLPSASCPPAGPAPLLSASSSAGRGRDARRAAPRGPGARDRARRSGRPAARPGREPLRRPRGHHDVPLDSLVRLLRGSLRSRHGRGRRSGRRGPDGERAPSRGSPAAAARRTAGFPFAASADGPASLAAARASGAVERGAAREPRSGRSARSSTKPGTSRARRTASSLNVWTPATPPASPLPVLFFIHGGGNVAGAGSYAYYDGTTFAEKGRAVVVTVNYRLSSFGWLAQPFLSAETRRGVSGNYGTFDQLAALRWVKRNIAAFGGDPSRVTIFGESAGGVNVCTLVASPLAQGPLRAGPRPERRLHAEAPRRVRRVREHADRRRRAAASAADPAACLRALPFEALLRAVPPVVSVASSSGQLWGPAVDGFVLRDSPEVVIGKGRAQQGPVRHRRQRRRDGIRGAAHLERGGVPRARHRAVRRPRAARPRPVPGVGVRHAPEGVRRRHERRPLHLPVAPLRAGRGEGRLAGLPLLLLLPREPPLRCGPRHRDPVRLRDLRRDPGVHARRDGARALRSR